MRVLLDESVAQQLGPLLVGHSVNTVQRQGWSGTSNGKLIQQAASEFDALVTGDQSLQHQQNLSGVELGVVVLIAPDNRVETITSMAPLVLNALESLQPGQVADGAAHDVRILDYHRG